MKTITIDPVTRLEGHGRVEIFLDKSGEVKNAYLQIPEFRGFEAFCQGRPAEEMPRITTRICGVCPGAHHLASTKALDDLYRVNPPAAAKKLRELFYCAHMIHSHLVHFYVLAGPDFIVGPDAPASERNIFGVIGKVGKKLAGEVLKHRASAQEIQETIGGKATHPVFGLPGGVSRGLDEKERKEVVKKARSLLDFSLKTLKIFEEIILKNEEYLRLINSDIFVHRTYYLGLVDGKNRVNFYEGELRVVDPEGKEVVKFEPRRYLEFIEERVESWTYLKFPYLKKVGWRGITDGKESGVYRVAPLARLNVADGMATPRAQEAYEKMFSALGRPAHATLANHWARVIELIYSAERLLELAEDKEIVSGKIRTIPRETPEEGIGVVEAPRGTLFHHYRTDSRGIITSVNLIVATGNNNAAISLSIRKAAEGFIRKGKVKEGLLNLVEMAIRAYDPCLACSTHSLPGTMPLAVEVYDFRGVTVKRLTRP